MKPSKFNRSVRVLENSHLASSTSLSSLTIRPDKGPTNEPGVLIALSPSARVELAWWLKQTLNANGSPVHLPPPDMIIATDASKKGWGAVHQSLQTNGRWSQRESLQHINYLELKASFLALKTFLKGRSHVTVSLQLDDTTAIAYINNKRGTRSPQLMTLALEMWDWCQERDVLVLLASQEERTSQRTRSPENSRT